MSSPPLGPTPTPRRRNAPRPRGRWPLWCCAALAAAGCSALVEPEALVTRCEVVSGAPDPCGELGLACMSGVCQACDQGQELCDGRDNDCDGQVDEGHDADGDGFTWCGGGRPELIDCELDDPASHPRGFGPDGVRAVAEPCDGRDNDCDGDIDEEPDCGDMRECEGGDCVGDLVCDQERDQCVAPLGRGSACSSDAQCAGGFCVSSDALGLETDLANSICATACCRDGDCGEGGVCVQGGTGARVCLPVEVAGRLNRVEGERCSLSFECASGVCHERTCVATCSSDSDCDGEYCRLNVATSTLLAGAGAWICGSAGGRDPPGELCTPFDAVACESALCLVSRCVAACGSSDDCPAGQSCRYVDVQGLLGEGRVTACLDGDSSDDEQTCCTNADCNADQVCRPVRDDRDWAMYCR